MYKKSVPINRCFNNKIIEKTSTKGLPFDFFCYLKKRNIASDCNKDKSNGEQVWICLHKLSSFYQCIIDHNYYKTANQGCKKICICYIPLHIYLESAAKNKATIKNAVETANDTKKLTIKSIV